MLVIYFRLVCGPSLGLGTMEHVAATATQFLHCTRNQTTQHRSDKWLILQIWHRKCLKNISVVDADRSNCPIYLIFNMQFMHKI